MDEREVRLSPSRLPVCPLGKAASWRGDEIAPIRRHLTTIMKWMHLVSEGFIHKGNDEEAMLSADLLGTLRE